jgi:hypothetical protein
MERVLRVFPAKNWPIVQGMLLALVGLFMFLVLKQSHWSMDVGIMLLLPVSICLMSYREARRNNGKATTDRERIDASEPFMQLALAVISVLALCISVLRSFHCT